MTAVDADVISLLPRASAGAKTRYLEGRQTPCALSSTWLYIRSLEEIGLELVQAENEVLLAGFGRGLRQPVHGDDLVSAILDALLCNAAPNRV